MDPVLSKEYTVSRDNFTRVGEASTQTKLMLKQIGFPASFVRQVAIAMYEGEVNMAIHAQGGLAQVDIFPDRVEVVLIDEGPGISDIPKAMEEGYSTASKEACSLGFGAGMGLANMKRNAHLLEIDSNVGEGTRVFMRFETEVSNQK